MTTSTLKFDLPTLKGLLVDAVDRLQAQLETLSLRIHANPEPAFEERKAAAWLSDTLESAGFEVTRGVGGLETAFVARHRGGDGPTIAILAEYDALPGIGHGCGHNGIGTSAVGAAVALKQEWPDLPGTLLVVGAPAEESGGGKAYLVEAGVFEGVAAALMVHLSTKTQLAPSLISMQEIVVEYRGKAAHASAKPQDGVNALDALVLAYTNIGALRQQLRPDARVHGIITHGGDVPNVIPDFTSGRFFVRANDDTYLDDLQERVLACFKAAAVATGATLEYRFPSKRYSAMRSNEALAQAFGANLRLLGIEERPPHPGDGAGSSDMGNVSQVVPAIHPLLAIAPATVPAHSLEFAEYAGSPAATTGLVRAAKAMALTVADLLLDDSLLTRVAEEFSASAAAT